MATNAPLNTEGILLPTTNRYDSQIIEQMEVNDPEFKQFLVWIQQELNDHANYMNRKDYAAYDLSESINGQTWFQFQYRNLVDPTLIESTGASTNVNFRQVYRKVINFIDGLPITGANPQPHGIEITDTLSFTRIYATASDVTNHLYKPIPYVDVNTPNNNIQIDVDATNVTITTAIDYSGYTRVYAVLEYIKI